MKKTACALSFIIVTVFLISVSVNSIPVISVVKANPYEPPVYNFLSPTNNTVYNTTSVAFKFLLEPVSGVDYAYYYSLDDRVSKKPISLTLFSVSEDPVDFGSKTYAFSVVLDDLSDGKHVLTLHHEAEYYNQVLGKDMIAKGSEPLIFYVDTVAPSISNLCVNGTGTDRLLNFTVSEEATWVGYSLDNKTQVTINGNATLKGLSAGSHNVTVFAEDEAGNLGVSETIFFTIPEPSEPFPTTLVATASVIIIVCVLAVFLLVRKHKH